MFENLCSDIIETMKCFPLVCILKRNCHELLVHISKFVCGYMPGFLAMIPFTESSLLSGVISFAAKDPLCMRAVLPCIDAALNLT